MKFKKYYHPLLFLFFITMPRAVDASVIFSEIAWTGTPESANAEWIEFYNTSTETIDMSGWKLYEAGGSTLVFTFTKQIPGKTYFVLERITPSAPDPLPDINDEAGSFGGSGLSNSGEHLVLKNVAGTVIAELDASSGWPAGDNTEKKTMQRSNGTWITAAPTPKAPPQTGTVDGSPEEAPPAGRTTPASTSQGPPPPVRSTASYMQIKFPEQVFQGQQHVFAVTPFIVGEERIHGHFYWNMGDGTVYQYTKNQKVLHTYPDSGKYSITISFGQNPYMEPFLIETTIVSVLDPSLSFSLEKEGRELLLSYKGEGIIDIGGWKVRSPEGEYVFPLYTRLLGGTIMRIKSTTTFPFTAQSSFRLITLQGVHVATLGTPAVSVQPQRVVSPARRTLAATALPSTTQPQAIADENIKKELGDEEKAPKNKSTSLFIFGGLIIVLVGLFVYFERRFGVREEE